MQYDVRIALGFVDMDMYNIILVSATGALLFRYPDEEGGQIPMAYIVQQPGQKLTAEEIMEWVAKQVGISLLFLGVTVCQSAVTLNHGQCT
jgi:hypothetical protein